jgi:integrase
VSHQGKRYRKDFPTKIEAAVAEADAKAALLRGELPPWLSKRAAEEGINDRTMRRLLEIVTAEDWRDAKGARTLVLNAKFVVNEIGPEVHPKDVDDAIIAGLVNTFLDLGNVGATVNRKLSALSKLLKKARRRKWISEVPEIPWQRDSAMRLRFFTEAEEGKILGYFRTTHDMEMDDLCIFAVDSGGRLSELLKATVMDLQAPSDGRSGAIVFRNTKNDTSRRVPLTARAYEVLAYRARNLKSHETFFGGLTLHAVEYRWRRMREYLGYEGDKDFVFHVWRHTFGSRLVQRGVAIQVVKDLMGHSTIQMTMRYAKLAAQNLEDAIALLEPAKPAVTQPQERVIEPAVAA